MMKLEQSGKLQSAFVLVKCSKKNHNDCRKIRDAVVEQPNGHIQEVFTTNAEIEGEVWCVAASALVPADETKKFEKNLLAVRTVGRHTVAVKNLKLVFSQ